MFCPKKKGFFPYLSIKIQESLSPEEKNAFGNLSNLRDRIKFVLSLPRLSSQHEDNLFKIIKPIYGEKSKDTSQQNREAGNSAFHAGNYRQCLVLYSVAVFTAPIRSDNKMGNEENCFALALANRSACLQRLHSYQLAISDIELSLESGYPKSKVFKLYERKAECYEKLGKYSQASNCYEKAISFMSTSTLTKEKKEDLKKSFKKKILEFKDKRDEDLINYRQKSTEDIEIIKTPNPNFPSAHSAIEIRYEPDRGRFAIASDDIPMGTTLISEQPITFSLYAEKMGSNCLHCFKVIKAVIPCPGD